MTERVGRCLSISFDWIFKMKLLLWFSNSNFNLIYMISNKARGSVTLYPYPVFILHIHIQNTILHDVMVWKFLPFLWHVFLTLLRSKNTLDWLRYFLLCADRCQTESTFFFFSILFVFWLHFFVHKNYLLTTDQLLFFICKFKRGWNVGECIQAYCCCCCMHSLSGQRAQALSSGGDLNWIHG